MIRLALALLLGVLFASSVKAELYDSYLPAAKKSLKDKKTLIVVIGASDW